MASVYVFNNGGNSQVFNADSGRTFTAYHGQYMYTTGTSGKMQIRNTLAGVWETVDVKSVGNGEYVSTDATMTAHTITPLWSFNCNEYGWCHSGGSRYGLRRSASYGTIDSGGTFHQVGTIPSGGQVVFATGQGYTGGFSNGYLRMNGYIDTGGVFRETYSCYVYDSYFLQHPNNYTVNTQ
jgi:hypothetical protein